MTLTRDEMLYMMQHPTYYQPVSNVDNVKTDPSKLVNPETRQPIGNYRVDEHGHVKCTGVPQ